MNRTYRIEPEPAELKGKVSLPSKKDLLKDLLMDKSKAILLFVSKKAFFSDKVLP